MSGIADGRMRAAIPGARPSGVLRSLLAAVVLCVAQGCTLNPPPAPADPGGERQLLVMIRSELRFRYQPGSAGLGEYGAASGDGTQQAAKSIARDYQLEMVSDWPMPSLKMHCFLMQVRQVASLDPTIAGLNGDRRVEWAQPVRRYKVLGHTDPYYGLQTAARTLRLDELHRISMGKGVRVAEIDTGIDTRHPDLDGQIAEAENFVDSGPYVPEVHGTAVAGIIAGRADNGVGIVGIAPLVSLLGLRACWENGGGQSAVCDSFSLAKALQFALRRDAKVINMSLSGPPDRLLSALIDKAAAGGAVIVAAADPDRPDGGFPASHPGVIAVTSEAPSLVSDLRVVRAPGIDVLTTKPPDSWGFFSGASIAAAHVSGIVALILARKPVSEPVLANALARSSAGTGSAVLDACAVFAAVLPSAECGCCSSDPRQGSVPVANTPATR